MIDTDHLRQFLVHICKKKDAKGDYLSPTVYHAFQHVSGYKSAIKDYYNNKNVKISEDSERMMEQFFKGYSRDEAGWIHTACGRETANVFSTIQVFSKQRN
jgi:predicted solute-binding protein